MDRSQKQKAIGHIQFEMLKLAYVSRKRGSTQTNTKHQIQNGGGAGREGRRGKGYQISDHTHSVYFSGWEVPSCSPCDFSNASNFRHITSSPEVQIQEVIVPYL